MAAFLNLDVLRFAYEVPEDDHRRMNAIAHSLAIAERAFSVFSS